MKKAVLFSLELKDLLKGFIMAVLTPALLIVQQSLDSGSLTFNCEQIAMASIAGAFAYLVKNFLTNSKGNFLTSEQSIGGSQIPPIKDEK